MFYHFKGTITADDYARILGAMTQRLMLVFSGILVLFTVVNLLMNRSQWLWAIVMGIIVILLGNLFLRWQLKSRFLKNFKPQAIDLYITEEQIRAQMQPRNVEIMADRVHFFQGKNQVMIFKKEMLENQGQWENFVQMSEKFIVKRKKK
jgi:hypothetical protein